MRNLNVTRAAAYAAAFTAIAFAPFTAQAQTAAASPDDVAALREQIRLLDQKLRVLERNLELKDETAAAEAKKQPVVAVGDRGLSVTSGDKAFSVRVGAVLHADYRYYLDDSAANGFQFRRVRPVIQGTFHEKFGFRVMPEFAGSNFQLLDATVSYTHSPALVITAGKFKAPFDLERLRSAAAITFIERAYPTILGPNREIGFQLSGEVLDKRLSYAVSLGNGVPDNANSVTNPDEELEYSVRLFATPFVNDKDSALAGLGFGIAATYGDKPTTAGAPSGYVSNGQRGIYSWNANTTSDGTHFRISPQATYYNGAFGLLASYVASEQEVVRAANARTITNTGWLVQGSYLLTGEKASYGAVTPAKPFKYGSGNWGAFEVAARVSELDIDDDVFLGGGGSLANPATSVSQATSYGIGLNWYLNRNVKAVVNFEQTRFEGGAAGGADHDTENALFSRIQFNF